MKKYIRYLIFAIALFLIVSMGRSTIGFLGKTGTIDEAQKKVEELEKEQALLLEVKEEVDSLEFVEKEARERLGLAKPGEVVLILPSDEVLAKLAPEIEDELKVEELPIYMRWLRLFFGLQV